MPMRPTRHDRIGRLGKEERRVANVVTHLANMLLVIAADAPDATHGEHLLRARHGDGGRLRRRDDVVLVDAIRDVSGHDLSFGCAEFRRRMRWQPADWAPDPATASGRTTRSATSSPRD